MERQLQVYVETLRRLADYGLVYTNGKPDYGTTIARMRHEAREALLCPPISRHGPDMAWPGGATL